MKFEQLKSHLQEGKLRPAYLVSGEDAFLVRSAVERLTALANDRDFNVSSFMGTYSVVDVREALYTLPFMGGRRVVVAYDCASDLTPMEPYFTSPAGDAVLVFAGALTPNFNNALKRGHVEVVDCARLNEDTLIRWIAATAARNGASITRHAAQTLIRAANGYLTRISVELLKLIDYADGRDITVKDVTDLVTFDLEFKIYELGDALLYRNGKKAAEILLTLKDGGSQPAGTLGYLYRHFRRLLFYKLQPASDTLSSDLGVSEYAVRAGLKSVRDVPVKRLKRLFDELHCADYAFKTGRIKDETALAAFVGSALS